MNNSIAHKLKNLRKTKGVTQQDIADVLGISRTTVSNYEIGRRMPSLNELKRLAEYFGVDLNYFGVAQTDDLFDLLARAKEVFSNENIPTEKKEAVYKELMRLYLNLNRGE